MWSRWSELQHLHVGYLQLWLKMLLKPFFLFIYQIFIYLFLSLHQLLMFQDVKDRINPPRSHPALRQNKQVWLEEIVVSGDKRMSHFSVPCVVCLYVSAAWTFRCPPSTGTVSVSGCSPETTTVSPKEPLQPPHALNVDLLPTKFLNPSRSDTNLMKHLM